MLHLFLLVLKIAGIILLTILGILILLLCAVLFVPVFYQLSFKTDGTGKGTEIKCRFTWFFSLLELKILYQNRASAFSARAAWKHIKGGNGADGEKEEDTEIHEMDEKKEVDADLAQEEEVEKAPAESGVHSHKDSKDSAPHEEKRTCDTQKDDRAAEKLQKAGRKISGFFQKIKCTIAGICDKINLFSEKKEKLILFLENEQHKKAFHTVQNALLRLLKKIFSAKGSVFFRYGLGDPYLTGTSLAWLAVLYPFLPGEIRIVPEFEEKALEGRARIRGSFSLVHLLVFAARILVSGAVRQTYRDIRKFISEF